MVKIVVDSGSDFPKELLEKYNLSYLKFETTYNGIVYPSSLEWEYFSKEDLVNSMLNGYLPSISQPSLGAWMNQINEFLKEGRDILYISIPSALSGGVRVFNVLKKLIKTDRKIDIVEVNGAGPVPELVALEILNNLKEEDTIEDIKAKVNDMNDKLHFYMISESMRQWAFSGRADDKIDFTYPKGVPLLKGNKDGTIRPMCLCDSFDDALSRLKKEIEGLKAEKCVINYTYGTYDEWLSRFEKTMVDCLGCKIIAKDFHSPTVTSVTGVNSISVAFI